ncbi:MAG: arylesterase [Pseudomonadota bacterium]
MPTVPFAPRLATCLLTALLLLTGSAARHTQAAEQTVLVLGDSISAAFGMALEQGWVALLAQRLNSGGVERPVINASISGDTSAGGLRRLPELLAEHRPRLLIIELGGNDGLRGYPTGELRENLIQMADLGREAGAHVLLLPMEIPPNLGSRYTRAFRQTFRDAAAASDSRLGPFILQDIATQPELMQEDGIHPTIEAQSMIVDHLQAVVEEMLLASAGS